MNNQTKNESDKSTDFFDALLQVAKEVTNSQQTPSTLCVNQSRNINNIKVNVFASSPARPGLFRRLLSKLF